MALLMMLLVTLLGVSMMRSVGVEARLVGATGDKQHAFQAAQTALQYGEWWLSQIDNASEGVPCTTTTATPLVCAAPQTQAVYRTVPWAGFGAPYLDPSIGGGQLFATSNIVTTGGAGTYAGVPMVDISFVGLSGNAKLYQITSVAYGGSLNSIAVVQSTVQVSDAVKCTTCDPN
ncbi:MAG: pilus assembly protein PilX [Pseudomonadota bacterium]|nr:pilus assembly protein PilX [Pseudomonadota bacterium]